MNTTDTAWTPLATAQPKPEDWDETHGVELLSMGIGGSSHQFIAW